MAIQGFKFTMLFNSTTESGFSETWYYESASTIANLPLTDFDALAAARDNLCASGVNLVGYRISDVNNPRMVYAARKQISPGPGSVQDPTSTAWLAIAYGANGVGRRQFWMRGMQDAWSDWNNASSIWNRPGDFTAKFNAFTGLITSAGSNWRIKTFDRAKGSASILNIFTAAPNPQGNGTVLTTVGAPGFTPQPIIVGGFKRPLSRLNGTYVAPSGYSQGSTTVTLLNKILPTAYLSAYAGGATVRLQNPSFTRVTHIELGEPRSRRVGRAFFVPAGRRRR